MGLTGTMYGAGDALPRVYEERFRTQMCSERVVYRGVWNKAVVVARKDEDETMLNHAPIQSRRRYGEVGASSAGSRRVEQAGEALQALPTTHTQGKISLTIA
jgi:hypothetical protein